MPFRLQAGVDALSNALTLEGVLWVSKSPENSPFESESFLYIDYYGKHIITRSTSHSLTDS